MAVESSIQGKINRGFGKAAQHLGHDFCQFRPRSTGDVIANINMLSNVMLAFDRDPNFSFAAPLEYKHAVYFALLNLSTVNIGDYLYDYDEFTFFVGNIEPLKPAMLFRCNRTVTIERQNAGRVAGGRNYGGPTANTRVLTNWPAAIINGGVGGPNVLTIPGATSDPGSEIYLPDYVEIKATDSILDDLGRRYTVAMAEQNGLGYRLVCRYVS